MVEVFRSTTPQKIDCLIKAMGDGDWSQVAELAHSVKGAAGHLGLTALEGASGSLEDAAGIEDGESVTLLCRDYRELCRRSLGPLDQVWAFVARDEGLQSGESISSLKR